ALDLGRRSRPSGAGIPGGGGVSWQWLPWPGDTMWLERRYDDAGRAAIERTEWDIAGEVFIHRPLHAMAAAVAGVPGPAPMPAERAALVLEVIAAIYAVSAHNC
ncbi:MAG: hypothetical protein ACOYEV_18815, partial [Candidatus Nanopelagicales bacterium]